MGSGAVRGCLLAVTLACAATAVAGDTSGGMRAYVDPRTGRLTGEPPSGAAVEPPTAAQSRSAAGLVEQVAPRGGYVVHLQGRFQSPLVATVGPDGTVHVGHGEAGE